MGFYYVSINTILSYHFEITIGYRGLFPLETQYIDACFNYERGL